MSNSFYHWSHYDHQRHIISRLRHIVKARKAFVYWDRLKKPYIAPSIVVSYYLLIPDNYV